MCLLSLRSRGRTAPSSSPPTSSPCAHASRPTRTSSVRCRCCLFVLFCRPCSQASSCVLARVFLQPLSFRRLIAVAAGPHRSLRSARVLTPLCSRLRVLAQTRLRTSRSRTPCAGSRSSKRELCVAVDSASVVPVSPPRSSPVPPRCRAAASFAFVSSQSRVKSLRAHHFLLLFCTTANASRAPARSSASAASAASTSPTARTTAT